MTRSRRTHVPRCARPPSQSTARAARYATPSRSARWKKSKGLVSGRWTLLDHFESDGRRYVLARRNEPHGAPLEKLTKRERQVVGYLALGHSYKLIAYELGISTSTVAALVWRACNRLGVESREELARLAIDASEEPPA